MADPISSAAQGAAIGSAVPGIGTLIGGGAGLLGGILGGLFGGGASDQAKKDQAAQLAAIQALQTPEFNKYNPVSESYTGTWTPELEKAINTGPSKAAQATGSTTGMGAEESSLAALQQLSQQGMSAADRAQMAGLLQQANAAEQGNRQAIMQAAAQRGQGGGGADLMAQLQASQGGANSAAQGALQVGAQAQAARMAALQSAAALGGNINQQQFGQQFQTGQASDVMNQFNVQNQIAQQARNAAAQTQAQAYGAQTQQGIANQNVGQQNYAQQYNNQILQQAYQDQAQKQMALAGAYGTAAGQQQQQAQNTAQSWNNIGQSVGQIGGGLYGAGAFNQGGVFGPAMQRAIGSSSAQLPTDQQQYDALKTPALAKSSGPVGDYSKV